jgi:hypothetical protein
MGDGDGAEKSGPNPRDAASWRHIAGDALGAKEQPIGYSHNTYLHPTIRTVLSTKLTGPGSHCET